jgi:hypothetical protein
MQGKQLGVVTVGAFVALALVGGCSGSKKTPATAGGGALATPSATSTTAAVTPGASATPSAGASATSSGNIGREYLAAIAPVDTLRDEYEASKGKPTRATIAPQFAASLRAFDVVAAKLPTSGRTESDMKTMISDDQTVANEVSANDLTVSNVDRDDSAHAVVRSDLGLPPA